MPHPARRFQCPDIIEDTRLHQLVKIFILIHTMQKAEVRIVRAERCKLPFKRTLNGFEIACPGVFALFVIDRAEVQLKKHLPAFARNGAPERCIHAAAARAQIKEIDPVLYGGAHDRFDLLVGALVQAARAEPQHTELFRFAPVRQLSVFHRICPFLSLPAKPLRLFVRILFGPCS